MAKREAKRVALVLAAVQVEQLVDVGALYASSYPDKDLDKIKAASLRWQRMRVTRSVSRNLKRKSAGISPAIRGGHGKEK